jgi:hypothetical protein
MTTTTAIESALRVLLHIRNVRGEQRSAVRELIRLDLALLRSARSGSAFGGKNLARRLDEIEPRSTISNARTTRGAHSLVAVVPAA